MNRVWRVFRALLIAAAGLLLCVFAVALYETRPTTASDNVKPAQALSYVHVSAVQYAAAYHQNEVGADRSYKGKKVFITGRVRSINKDIGGTANLELGGGGSFDVVVASLNALADDWAAGLKRGDSVTLLCVGSGQLLNAIMLSDCMNTDFTGVEQRIPE